MYNFSISTGTHYLDDIGLIPPCDRVLLEMLYLDLDKWTVSALRDYVIDADANINKYYNQLTNENNSNHVCSNIIPLIHR